VARDQMTRTRALHYVYILRCADGTLYTGYALDPTARARIHNAGRGARYTLARRPVTLVYSESFRTKSHALRREMLLKRWPKVRKEALIESSRLRQPQRRARIQEACANAS
jgi:putative endonuclease